MAIEYIIGQECPVKQKLTSPGMVEMLKQRLVALRFLKKDVQDGMSEQQARDGIVSWKVRTPTGGEDVQEYRVGYLLDTTQVLDIMKDHCTDCPAARGTFFGCYGTVNFPITAKAERWLAGLARKAGERKDTGNIPIRLIFDRRMTGAHFARMRQDPMRMYLELSAPIEIGFEKGSFRKKAVNTDQVLQVLFLTREVGGPLLEVLSFFSGGLAVQENEPREGDFQSAFVAVDETRKEVWYVFNLPEEEGDDSSTRQLKGFFRAVFLAYELDKGIVIDL